MLIVVILEGDAALLDSSYAGRRQEKEAVCWWLCSVYGNIITKGISPELGN
jgi:hypothetical protein